MTWRASQKTSQFSSTRGGAHQEVGVGGMSRHTNPGHLTIDLKSLDILKSEYIKLWNKFMAINNINHWETHTRTHTHACTCTHTHLFPDL